MTKFEEAIKVNGKATLGCGGYVEFNSDDVLVDNNGVQQKMARSYLDDDDWEVYEEPEKTLSDKIITSNGKSYKLEVSDVKESLKKFIESYKHLTPYQNLKQKAIEIFGGDLVDYLNWRIEN